MSVASPWKPMICNKTLKVNIEKEYKGYTVKRIEITSGVALTTEVWCFTKRAAKVLAEFWYKGNYPGTLRQTNWRMERVNSWRRDAWGLDD